MPKRREKKNKWWTWWQCCMTAEPKLHKYLSALISFPEKWTWFSQEFPFLAFNIYLLNINWLSLDSIEPPFFIQQEFSFLLFLLQAITSEIQSHPNVYFTSKLVCSWWRIGSNCTAYWWQERCHGFFNSPKILATGSYSKNIRPFRSDCTSTSVWTS
jgi:hypothetical protein